MRKLTVGGVFVALILGVLAQRSRVEAAKADGPMLVHDVYFTLKDNSADAKKEFVASCKKYLSKHPGVAFFATGTRAQELKREVNDQDFDVALTIVFKNRAAHDKYQESDRHQQFIKDNKERWKKVRVFDSLVRVFDLPGEK